MVICLSSVFNSVWTMWFNLFKLTDSQFIYSQIIQGGHYEALLNDRKIENYKLSKLKLSKAWLPKRTRFKDSCNYNYNYNY